MFHRRHLRAAVDPVSLVLIVVLGLGAAKLAGWKPLAIFAKKPPTEQVTKLQADLEKAKAELAAADAAKRAADAAERDRQEEQVRWSQQMTAGAADALTRQPAEHRTPETQLAADLLARANFGLAAALGSLPRDKQAEIITIVDRALSAVQADRDAALAALQAKDRELHAVTLEREQIKAQIPVLAARLETKDATVREVEARLNLKTSEVLTYAAKASEKERDAGSLSSALNRLLKIVIGASCVWAFLAYVLPLLLKLMRPGRTKNLLRDVTGYATGGLLYHDAKKKLARNSSAA